MNKQCISPTGYLCIFLLIFFAIPGYSQRAPITFISPNGEDSGYFGSVVSAAGDVNNDGFDDIIIGAYQENPGGSPENAGRAYIFSGADSSLLYALQSPNEALNGNFGYAVAAAGDVNNDGFADVIVGAYFESGAAVNAGRTYVFSGINGNLIHTLNSPNPENQGFFGWSVAGTVDVNNDGTSDLIVGAVSEDNGAMDAGRVYVFSGTDASLLLTLASPAPEISGNFGRSLSGIADVNNDGNDDILIGAFFEDGGALKSGNAYLFSGVDGSLLRTFTSPNPESNGYFGWSVSGTGDINNDGTSDVIVGAFLEDGLATNGGHAYVFSGGDGSLLYSFTSPHANTNSYFGWSVAGAGDINNDGFDDLISGAFFEDGSASKSGRAYIFSGMDGSVLYELTSPHAESFGYFGWSVAGAGDIDNDGRDDVAVGAFFENGGATDAGRAYVFVYRPPIPQGNFLLAGEEIIFKHHTYSEGLLHSNGKVEFQRGSPSTQSQNIRAVGDVKISIGNIIEGDVIAGGQIINKGTVSGIINPNANVAAIPLPELAPFTPGTENVKVRHYGSYTLPPGSYGLVVVGNEAEIYLSSGEYNMQSLEMGTESFLFIDVSAGPVTINLVGLMNVKPRVSMEITGDVSGYPSTQVTINTAHTGEMRIRKYSKFYGTLNAPHAHIIIQQEAFFKGAIAAREIEIQHDVTAVFHASPLMPNETAGLAKIGEDSGSGLTLLPAEFKLHQNYPNPFNPVTTIRFALPEAGPVNLKVYDIQGQVVRTLISGYREAGYHNLQWDATNEFGVKVASGMYFYRLETTNFQQVKRMLLVR